MDKRPLVAVVDDSESVRESLPDLLKEFGFAVQAFSSAEAFLASDYVDKTQCLILDVAMPGGMSGPDLQQELLHRRKKIPIIFITAYDSKESRQQAMQAGAVAFLSKPFNDELLFETIRATLPNREPSAKTA